MLIDFAKDHDIGSIRSLAHGRRLDPLVTDGFIRLGIQPDHGLLGDFLPFHAIATCGHADAGGEAAFIKRCPFIVHAPLVAHSEDTGITHAKIIPVTEFSWG